MSAAKENCELLVCWDRQGKKTVETTQVSINAAYDNDPEESFRYLRFRVAEAKLRKTLTSAPVVSDAVPMLLCNRWMGGVNNVVSWCE